MRELQVQAEEQPTVRPPQHRDAGGRIVFRYQLVDIAGRPVDVVERRAPLHADETIVIRGEEAWRIVAVLGTSATVTQERERRR